MKESLSVTDARARVRSGMEPCLGPEQGWLVMMALAGLARLAGGLGLSDAALVRGPSDDAAISFFRLKSTALQGTRPMLAGGDPGVRHWYTTNTRRWRAGSLVCSSVDDDEQG